MVYKIKKSKIEAFQFDGDLMNNKGKWYIPDWAVRLYQEDKLWFSALKPFMPPCELFVKATNGTHHVRVGDYIVKQDDVILMMPKDVFEALYEKEND